MATQHPVSDIPIIYKPDQGGVRLLELPSELCDLITSSNQAPQLSLKSAESSEHPNRRRSSLGPAEHVVLCTATQTYQLRQVQSSNTVLVLRPYTITSHDEDMSVEEKALCVFSTCSNSLELSQLDTTTSSNLKIKSADERIRDALPAWESTQDEEQDDLKAASGRSKRDIFADIPFSEGECQAAWGSIGAFEVNGRCVKPSTKTLMHLWTTVFQSIDITKPFNPIDHQNAIDESGIPLALFKSVLTHLSASPPPIHSDIPRELELEAPIQLDKDKTVVWVGEIHYGKQVWQLSDTPRDPASMTLDGWRALLPESWGDGVTLDKFAELRYDRFKPSLAKAGKESPVGAGKRAGKSRDWHQKFKRTKTK